MLVSYENLERVVMLHRTPAHTHKHDMHTVYSGSPHPSLHYVHYEKVLILLAGDWFY